MSRSRGKRRRQPPAGRGHPAREPGKPAAPAAEPLSLTPLSRGLWLQAAAALALLTGLFAWTAAPTIHVGDSPEFAATAALFGVPHPPGYPLYTLVTALWVHAQAWVDPAHASNIMSGVYAAAAAALALLLLARLGLPAAACWVGALCLALGRTLWSQAAVAEVYTFDALLLLLLLHATLTLAARPRGRTWFLWGLCLGLWGGHRMVNIIYLPAVLLLLWALRVGRSLPLRIGALLAGGALSLLPLAYLPLASLYNPHVDNGDPQSLEMLWKVLTASPYRGLLGGGTLEVALRRVWLFLLALPAQAGVAAPLALVGGWWLARRGRAPRLLLAGLSLLVLAGVIFTAAYDILDYDAYLIPATAGICLLGALGAGALLERVGEGRARRGLAAGLVALALAGLPLSWRHNDLRRQDQIHRTAGDVLASVDPRGLLFVHGDTPSTALDYLQGVEGRSPDVIVIRLGNIHPWYLGQLQARFPDEPWPAFEPGVSQGVHAYRIIQALGPRRRVYLTMSVDPKGLLPPDGPYGWFQRGLVREVRRRGDRFDLRKLATWNEAFLTRALARHPTAHEQMDMDLKAQRLQYALALQATCGMLARLGDYERASGCFQAVLAQRPDYWEQQMKQETAAKSGLKIPTLKMGQNARQALQRLESLRRARPAPPDVR